ncbi:MAG: glycosyl transferase family 2, partial [Segetibacter sp.]|nr:glycosyl transferase family 2 [Segetibacter sp.]
QRLHLKYILKKPLMPYKDFFKNHIPNFLLRTLHKAGLYQNYIPKTGNVSLGDLNRTTPFSRKFGFDRGRPVDRYYIENFLQKNAAVIKGRVLEIADNEYTVRFGGDQVTKSEILHIDDKNPKATIVADLSNAPGIADNSFDCIILTQTLHLIYDYKKALETCYRILKPGGTLLLTVPGISQIDMGEWYKYWLWSFNDNSIKRLLAETFPIENTVVHPYGNVLVATAFLYGMGSREIKKKQIDYQDPHYQVIITASATKP